jgi:hypothetical protein
VIYLERALLTGIACVASLQNSKSYVGYDVAPIYDNHKGVELPEETKSMLLVAMDYGFSNLVNVNPSTAELVPRTASNREKIIHECLVG